jgi:hypothetical protein
MLKRTSLEGKRALVAVGVAGAIALVIVGCVPPGPSEPGPSERGPSGPNPSELRWDADSDTRNARDACLTGQPSGGFKPGHGCSTVFNKAAGHGFLDTQRYYMLRGCELGDAFSCLIGLEEIGPSKNGTPQEIARVRSVSSKFCQTSIRTEDDLDQTPELCARLGENLMGYFKPGATVSDADRNEAKTALSRGCSLGDMGACGGLDMLGVGFNRNDAERAGATHEDANRQTHEDNRQERRDRERQDDARRQGVSDALGNALTANGLSGGAGTSSGSATSKPQGSTGSGGGCQAGWYQCGYGCCESNPGGCAANEHVCPASAHEARVCCPNN